MHFLARETLFKNFFFGRLLRALNTHPVRGDGGDVSVMKMVCSLLEEGKKVILFPEGTRSFTGEVGEIKPGVAMLASRTKTAIIPTYLQGSFQIWNRKQKFPKLWGKTICVFGSPIQWENYAHLDKKEAQASITKQLKASILALKKWLDDGAHGSPP